MREVYLLWFIVMGVMFAVGLVAGVVTWGAEKYLASGEIVEDTK